MFGKRKERIMVSDDQCVAIARNGISAIITMALCIYFEAGLTYLNIFRRLYVHILLSVILVTSEEMTKLPVWRQTGSMTILSQLLSV